MAQYKVLQDIEAEDKLLGPLSLRQFIYAAITIALGFAAFKLFVSSAWFLGFIFLPPALFFGLLAAPIGGQQSSEIWLLAKIRFFLKPRKRIWDQSGLQELVTITVPKKIEKHLTKGYSEDEVTSRLKTLSATLDTRGWAVKNSTNMYVGQTGDSDRLLDISAQPATTIQAEPATDMLDPAANPRAAAMDQMITKSAVTHRQTIEANLRQHAAQAPSPTQAPPQLPPISEQDEQNLLEHIRKTQAQPQEFGKNMKTIQPASVEHQTNKPKPEPHQSKPTVTAKADPAILNIVENSEDLSVQTIARQANRVKNMKSDDEVVISLH